MNVKIVATIGPATVNDKSLKELHKAGMSVARLNGSHSDLDWHENAILTIRQSVPGVPILLDIPGRKIRTAKLKEPFPFKSGDPVIFTSDLSYNTPQKIPVNFSGFSKQVTSGDILLADDGTLGFSVKKTVDQDVHTVATCDGVLKSAKGINIPNVAIKTELVTEKDKKFLDFAKKMGVDFIGLSFVDSGNHVEAIRDYIGQASPRIIAKIENKLGLQNMDEVIEHADAIMIDRGDLSVETKFSTVSLDQKKILQKARELGKSVIVATEMLHTMITNRYPTKAEVSDITNAVLDGASAVMLSGETAIGSYPVESVKTMTEVKDAAWDHILTKTDQTKKGTKVSHAMANAIGVICEDLDVTKIVVITKSGFAARVLSMRSLKQPIIAVSNDAVTARSFNLFKGVEGIHADVEFSKENLNHIPQCLYHLWKAGKIVDSDLVLVTAVGYPKSGNRMNMIQTHKVEDLKQTLKWS